MRSRSSANVFMANSLVLSSAEQQFKVYGAWARITLIPLSAANSLKAAISSTSIGFAEPPLGFLVKNWKVLPPIDIISLPILRNPFDVDK